MKLKLGSVVDVFRPHRTDDAQIIGAVADVPPPVTYVQTAFATFAKTDLHGEDCRPLLTLEVVKEVSFVFQKG